MQTLGRISKQSIIINEEVTACKEVQQSGICSNKILGASIASDKKDPYKNVAKKIGNFNK